MAVPLQSAEPSLVAPKPRLTYAQFMARPPANDGPLTIAAMLERYIAEVHPLRAIGRSQMYVFRRLMRVPLSGKIAAQLKPSDIIDHCRMRRAGGAGPSTVGQDLSYLRGPLAYAALSWDMPAISVKPITDARLQLEKLGLIGKANTRDRRPTRAEYETLLAHFKVRDLISAIPMAVMTEFAVWSARRLSEITRLRWSDVDHEKRTCIVRDMKDPRRRVGNHHMFPLLGRAWDIVMAQPRVEGEDRIFPYNPKSAGARFTRAKKVLGIVNLHYHDLRREAASRLFEAGYSVQEVQLVTGHRNPQILLQVYTKLNPADLHLGPALLRRVQVKAAANDGDEKPIAA